MADGVRTQERWRKSGGRTVFSTDRQPGATLVRPTRLMEEGVRVSRRRIGFWYRLAAVICKPPLVVLFKRDWRGMEHIPADGGFITAVNHNSYIDPLSYAHFQYNTGRVPRFLAKDGLFKGGFVGKVMKGTGQIPVYRETTNALDAFRAAVDAIERGECVAFYPEGTLTRDPEMWPMTAKSGAARVALQTKCPVDPRRPVGRQPRARRRTARSSASSRARPSRCSRAAGRPVALLRQGAHARGPAGGDRGHHGRGHRTPGGDPAARRPPRRRTTRARPGWSNGARRPDRSAAQSAPRAAHRTAQRAPRRTASDEPRNRRAA